MPAARNLYEILNVSPDAEPVVIEAAYRALMKKYHPDHVAAAATAAEPGAPSAADINKAFATLRDPQRRSDYDRREWTRSQNIQLAQYQAPPAQRLSKAFGWGGWVVAIILGVVIALIAGRAGELAAARTKAAQAAASAEPDFRSQPSLPDVPLAPAADVPAPASVPAGRVLPQGDGTSALTQVAPPVDAALAAAAAATGRAAAQAAPRSNARSGYKPRRKPQARRPRTAAERDFLEREGYIY